MGKSSDEDNKCIFPLTNLQIGDLQSYLSHLSIFMGPDSKNFYILVDNRPWLRNLISRPAHIWQLMVTKSRLSPFANTRARGGRKETKELSNLKPSSESNTSAQKKFERWFSLVDAATSSRKKALLPVKKLRNSLIMNSKLHRILYGFIVFEVAWANVRGINYVNELQTDTSLAIEARIVQRWEFDSIAQAASCISVWFSGTRNEQLLLKEVLDAAVEEVFYDAEEVLSETNLSDDDDINFSVYPATMESRTSGMHTPPPPTGPNKRRRLTNSFSGGVDVDIYSEERESGCLESSKHLEMGDCEDPVEATEYRDVLILFRFDDRDLPFRLRQIIMSDLRLLTLLESGLPSWVIFVQSYPGFCHLYRTWMCPLVRALYVLISVVTVLIGFYDLYKNVPVLKATASRLCGPLLDWIETWEMVTRIKYLGTMLFLHNVEKAVMWFLMITRTTRSFLSVLTQPMAGPLLEFLAFLLPFWNMCMEAVDSFGSVIWIVIESSCSVVGDLVQILVQPIWFILRIAFSVIYPIFWILWEILYAPIRLVLTFSSLVAFTYTWIYDLVGDLWLFVSSILQFTSASDAMMSTSQVPMWRSLWNDLFSQIFRALRSILHGFVAFFTACNRHRLSIYNYFQEFIQRLSGRSQRSQSSESRHSKRTTGGTPRFPEARKIHFN